MADRLPPLPPLLPPAARRVGAAGDGWEPDLLQVLVLITWMTCLAIGVLGLRLGYPWPQAPPKVPPPVQAELLNVEVTDEPIPAPANTAAHPDPLPPAAPQPVAMEAAPPLAVVAAPSPSIAFAQPVEGPARIGEARDAVPGAPDPNAKSMEHVQRLTYGRGEGKQPAPDYPREALNARQQGAVVVRFSVDESGHVQDVRTVTPSPWPLLNQAAANAVRERWRFRAGPPRTYEVSIRFKINDE